MTWEIEGTDEFEHWFDELGDAEQASVAAAVDYLGLKGPHLGAPYSSAVRSSRHPHMRELRIQHRGRPLRVSMPSIHGAPRFCCWGATRRATTGGTSGTCRSPMICTTRTWPSSGERG